MWGCPLFLPLAHPEGQGRQSRREGGAPCSPHIPRQCELGGPGLRLLASGYGWKLRWWFNRRCFKPRGNTALTCLVQSSCISWQPLVEREAPVMVCPTPSYQQKHLWGLLAPTCKPPWVPKVQPFPAISLWHSSLFPVCLHTSVLGAFDQDGRSLFKVSQPPRIGYSDLQYLKHVVGGKELQHLVCATVKLQRLETRPENKQGLRDLCRWEGISWGL